MDDLAGILAVIGLFGGITAIVVLPGYFKSRERIQMQETLRAAIDKGQPLPPEVIEAMTKNVKPPATALTDLRKGVIWLAVGIGLAVFAGFITYHEGDDAMPMLGMAAIPVTIGVAFIVLSFFNPNKGLKANA